MEDFNKPIFTACMVNAVATMALGLGIRR